MRGASGLRFAIAVNQKYPILMSETQTKLPSFGTEAENFLKEFYKSVGAETAAQKVTLLQIKLDDALGGTANFYALGGEVSDAMKLGCLEYEFLERLGKIPLVHA